MNLERYIIPSLSTARTSTEALINDIAEATTEKHKKKLARALAITAKTLKWSDTDLHALYQKRLEPGIRNYTAFVWSRVKIANKKEV
jgi:hypothetical protein